MKLFKVPMAALPVAIGAFGAAHGPSVARR